MRNSSLREGFREPFALVEEAGAQAFAERNRHSVDMSSYDAYLALPDSGYSVG
jgi:hypothetical protein